jgi:hypothetical protein
MVRRGRRLRRCSPYRYTRNRHPRREIACWTASRL